MIKRTKHNQKQGPHHEWECDQYSGGARQRRSPHPGYVLLWFMTVLAIAAAPASALAVNGQETEYGPFEYIDGSLITLTGVVAAVNGPEFTLDYGEGSITVEMDETIDAPYEAEDVLVPGETVTVSGIIDDDIFERRTIEAGGVYVHQTEAHYLSNMLDDQDAEVFIPPPSVAKIEPAAGPVAVTGTIVDLEGSAVVVDTGAEALRVDLGDVEVLPFAGGKRRPLMVGDQVRVLALAQDGVLLGQAIETLPQDGEGADTIPEPAYNE